MSDLADLFELMHAAPESFRTLRATIRTWRDDEVYRRADARWVEQVRRRGAGVSGAGVLGCCGGECDSDRTWERFESVWLERPNRLRLERQGVRADTIVRDGGTRWFYSSLVGALESEADGPSDEGELTELLRPLPLVAALGRLELVGEAVVAGRLGTVVAARPRIRSSAPPDPGEPRGDEIEFVLDRERGLVLRWESRLEGEPFSVTEFTELELDRALDPQVFVFSPPPGERVRTYEELKAELAGVGFCALDRAAAQASFTVYVPGMIWPRAQMHVVYWPRRERPQHEENVSLTYSDPEPGSHASVRRLSLIERAPEAALLPAGDWEPVSLDGVEAFVGTPTALPFQSSEQGVETPLIVRMLREGTQIEIQGWGLERSELLGLARSLEPARTGPPPGFR